MRAAALAAAVGLACALAASAVRADPVGDAERMFRAALAAGDIGALETLGASRPPTRWSDDAWSEAAILNSGIASKTAWLSPPMVNTSGAFASVSYNSVEPERGGETIKTGRSNFASAAEADCVFANGVRGSPATLSRPSASAAWITMMLIAP